MYDTRSSSGRAWKSTNAGDSWTTLSTSTLRDSFDASAVSSNFSSSQTIGAVVELEAFYLSEDAGATWFALDGLFAMPASTTEIALPHWNGRISPLIADLHGFYVYQWPQALNVSYGCSTGLALGESSTQSAELSIGSGFDKPFAWDANVLSLIHI